MHPLRSVSAVTESFPRQYARTQRFTLGEPRNIAVSPDGARVVFLRSGAGDDPVNSLWVMDTATGEERLVADPARLLGESADDLPPEERARRERAREAAGGITGFATDTAVRVTGFALGGRLFVAGLLSGRARPLEVEGREVPGVLRSGNHDKINRWRLERAVAETVTRRPDLIKEHWDRYPAEVRSLIRRYAPELDPERA